MRCMSRDGSSELGPGVGFTIKRLWEDEGIKEVFSRRGCLQINDSVGFFLDNMDRITEEGYTPTEQVNTRDAQNQANRGRTNPNKSWQIWTKLNKLGDTGETWQKRAKNMHF